MSAKADQKSASRSILDQNLGDPKFLCRDVVTLGTYSEEFYKSIKIEPVITTWKKFEYIVNEIPSILNRNSKANPPSVFKQAAALTIAFIQTSPLDQTFPPEKFSKLTEIRNHQNAIVVLEYCRQCLHGAAYVKNEDGKPAETVVLKNKIKVSRHFYYDLVFAISEVKTDASFHFLSLTYESLAYKANKRASYPEIV